MRFLRKNKIEKSVVIISDIHLGAGVIVKGQRNFLEDFHYDEELVEFIEYHSSDEFSNREVELIINGDLLDLLAVPFVEYFDDEFWSEEAALEKLNIILDAHPEVLQALNKFASIKKKSIRYIIGNHDAEMIFKSLQDRFLEEFDKENRDSIIIDLNPNGEYRPVSDIVIKHGHEYEVAHNFDPNESIIENEDGRKFFMPPWGSYYVTRVINKFKEDRHHINAVRPIKKFLIHGLIYDTFLTLRFIFATCFYFIMVRFIEVFKQHEKLEDVFKNALAELELFEDYQDLTREYLEENKDVKALIVGHTHEPIYHSFRNGKVFVNTGTWTKMHHMDFGKNYGGDMLSFAKIDIIDSSSLKEGDEKHLVSLNIWKGKNSLPYTEF